MPKRILAFLKYLVIFVRELVNANIAVVKLVLSKELKIRPGFISVPMTVRGDFEVTSYANSITLTPGTISTHIPDDRHAIVIHAIDAGDPESVRQSCINALEIPIMRWTRGEPAGPTTGAGSSPTTGSTSTPEVPATGGEA